MLSFAVGTPAGNRSDERRMTREENRGWERSAPKHSYPDSAQERLARAKHKILHHLMRHKRDVKEALKTWLTSRARYSLIEAIIRDRYIRWEQTLSLVIFRTIRDRRSVRRYLLKEVSNTALRRVLDAARWVPSAHNAQPWRFILIKDPNLKRRLAKAMAGEWNRDLRKDGILREERERLIKGSIKQFTDPPILIVVCLTMNNTDKCPDKERQEAEYVMAVQSVAAAIQNMLLIAHAEGLGACWFCAPLFCPEVVRETLGIPKDISPQTLITLGYPAERPTAPPRKPLEDVVHQNHWGTR